MAPKRKSEEQRASPIQVAFVGSKSIFWEPPTTTPDSGKPARVFSASPPVAAQPSREHEAAAGESQSVQKSSQPMTHEQLKSEFIAHLRSKIDQQQDNFDDSDYIPDNHDKFISARQKLQHLAVLAVALDPTSKLEGLFLDKKQQSLSLASHFDTVFFKLMGLVEHIVDTYANRDNQSMEATLGARGRGDQEDADDGGSASKRQKQEKDKKPASKAKGRGVADKNAQRDVPTWYKGRCILSGLIKPQGAHIVPVRAIKRENPLTFYKILACFWPLPEIEELVVKGRETTNILPLCPDAHALWDQYSFAIRPIEDPSDPKHKLLVQMVWLKDLDTEGGLVSGDWDHDGCGSIADFRRGKDGMYPSIKHGDVYEITTSDPEARPLPDFHLLQIQYGVHKMLAGIRAAGALRRIFSDDPPDDPGPVSLSVPPQWESLIEAAVDAGVLDTTAARLWGKAVTREWYGAYGLAEDEESG